MIRRPHTQGHPGPVLGPRGWVRGCTATEGVTLALVTGFTGATFLAVQEIKEALWKMTVLS